MDVGYFDESGIDSRSSVVSISGLIASSEQWSAFDIAWAAALASSPSISRFKANEAAGLKGAFFGWSSGDRDRKLELLAKVATTNLKLQASCVVSKAELEAVHSEAAAASTWKNPYSVALLELARSVSANSRNHGLVRPIQLVFDRQVMFEARIREAWPHLRQLDYFRESLTDEPRFSSDDEALPLQAADLFAWAQRVHFEHRWFGASKSQRLPLAGVRPINGILVTLTGDHLRGMFGLSGEA